MRNMKKLVLAGLIGAMTVAGSAVALERSLDGVLQISTGSVAAGIGWTWGGGTLAFDGQSYDFDIKGLSLADVGISEVKASGIVYNLKNIDDFNGTYVGLKAGVTIAGGVGAVALQNEHGVVLELNGTSKGLKFSFGTEGVTITLKK